MRLIDADKLEPSEVYMNYGFTRIVYMDDVDEMPTVDAVEVVRCKDCVCNEEGWCYVQEHIVCDNEFCSWCERRKDG